MQPIVRPLTSSLLRRRFAPQRMRQFATEPLNPEICAPFQLKSSETVMIRAAFQLGDGDKTYLKQDKCLAPVSIGQQVHSGAHLAATLSLINRSFKECTFVLADSLQGYTKRIFQPNTPLDNLKETARLEGFHWLRVNNLIINMLTIPWKVIHWDTILEDPNFPFYLKRVKEAYYTNPSFKEGCDENVMEYLARNSDYPISTDQAKAFCLEYIFCECAAMFAWLDEDCQWELYANGRKRAMQETYRQLIEPNNPTLIKPLSLRFKKVRNYEHFLNQKKDLQIHEYGCSRPPEPIKCFPR